MPWGFFGWVFLHSEKIGRLLSLWSLLSLRCCVCGIPVTRQTYFQIQEKMAACLCKCLCHVTALAPGPSSVLAAPPHPSISCEAHRRPLYGWQPPRGSSRWQGPRSSSKPGSMGPRGVCGVR